jgi:hypothetical protein
MKIVIHSTDIVQSNAEVINSKAQAQAVARAIGPILGETLGTTDAAYAHGKSPTAAVYIPTHDHAVIARVLADASRKESVRQLIKEAGGAVFAVPRTPSSLPGSGASGTLLVIKL